MCTGLPTRVHAVMLLAGVGGALQRTWPRRAKQLIHDRDRSGQVPNPWWAVAAGDETEGVRGSLGEVDRDGVAVSVHE